MLYGDDQWGEVHALDGNTGEEFLTIDNPEHGVTIIIVDDFDNDGKNDLAWGAGYSSSGADYWFIADPK